jgi:ERF superfamily
MPVMMSPTVAELAKALCAVQAKLEPAVKNATNPHLKSKYADLSSCYEASRALLTANGLTVVQPGEADGGMVGVTTILLHTSGEYIGSTFAIPLPEAKAQLVGSLLTYFRRYTYQSVIGLSSEDDDGQAVSEAASMRQAVERVSAPQRQEAPARQEAAPQPRNNIQQNCPTCNGEMWDNRKRKADGTMKPSAPDWKCMDKNCGGAIWPPRGARSTRPAAPPPMPPPPDDELPSLDETPF